MVHKAVEGEVRERKYSFLFWLEWDFSKGRGLFPTHLKLKENFLAVNKSSRACNTLIIFFSHWNFFRRAL